MSILANAKHERFAQGIASGLTATEAYERAGYKRDGGAASRLSGNVNVLARVQELQEVAAKSACLSREWVLDRLMQNAERAMQHEAIKGSDGEETGEFKYDGSVANRALELLGKELGMFVDRSENVNINHDVSDKPLSTEQWAEQHSTTH